MYDTVIKNVRIIDGSGTPWYRGDIGLRDGRIRKIGLITQTENVVDGKDRYAVPGFLDIHSHSDTTLMEYPEAESRILQGITTEIGGNCGLSAAPVSHDAQRREMLRAYVGDLSYEWNTVGEFLAKMEQIPISVNFGTEVGHGSILWGLQTESRLKRKWQPCASFSADRWRTAHLPCRAG